MPATIPNLKHHSPVDPPRNASTDAVSSTLAWARHERTSLSRMFWDNRGVACVPPCSGKKQNSCRSAIGTVHKRALGRINFHTGLIIPFLIGPLSGVFPFPHTSMMEPKKTWRGMPGSWRWLRFHIGFWHWLKLRCYVSHLLGKNPVQKTWKDMLKNIVKLCCGQFGGKPREIGRCRSIGDWEEKSAEVPGESGWQTS